MAKDKKARELGHMTLAAIGIVMGSIVDVMKGADIPNDVVHLYLDRLEEGFETVLWGDAQAIMYGLVDVLRTNVPSND
jgi:hypothetical protein